MLMFMGRTIAWDLSDVSGLPALPPETMVVCWSRLLPKAMSGSRVLLQSGSELMSVAHVTTEGQVEVHSL